MNPWDLLRLNMQFYQSVLGEAEAELARLKLEVKSFFLLSAVEECKYPAELAKRCLMPKPTVSFMIKRLEKHGYLVRKSVEGDLRKFELELTVKGKQVAETGQVIVSRCFEKRLSKLSSEELESYVRFLSTMQG